MRALVTIQTPLPVGWGVTYGDFFFAKYGVCTWEYEGGWYEPVSWINFIKSAFEPKFYAPVAFHYYLVPRITAHVDVVPIIKSKAPDIILDTLAVNLTKGLNVLVPPGP